MDLLYFIYGSFWKNFLVQHELVFLNTRLLFVQHQIFFGHNFFFFRATPNFCFYCILEWYVRVINFYCHVAAKENHFYATKKLTSFFVHRKFFIFNSLAWYTCLIYKYSLAWYTEAVTKSCSGKKVDVII